MVERTASGAMPWPNEPGEPYVFYTLTNHLGSASVTVNAEQVLGQDDVIVAQTQLAYGTDDALVENDAFAWRPDYEFTGKEEDPDIHVVYFVSRFLHPFLGRWISPDPLVVHSPNASDANVFRYSANNPIVFVDPSGTRLELGHVGRVDTPLPNDPIDPSTANRQFDDLREGMYTAAETVTYLFTSRGQPVEMSKTQRQRFAMAAKNSLSMDSNGNVSMDITSIEDARTAIGKELRLKGAALSNFAKLTETENALNTVIVSGELVTVRDIMIEKVHFGHESDKAYTQPTQAVDGIAPLRRTNENGKSVPVWTTPYNVYMIGHTDSSGDVWWSDRESQIHELAIHAAAMVTQGIGASTDPNWGAPHGEAHGGSAQGHTSADDSADRIALEVGRRNVVHGREGRNDIDIRTLYKNHPIPLD